VIRSLGLLVGLLGLWWLLSGYAMPLLLTFGVLSALLVTGLAVHMKLNDAESVPLHLLGRIVLYIPWLVREIWRANIAVARVVVSRDMPISPTLFRVPARQRTELGRAVYGNSITLTPGTVTVRVEDDFLEVHALTREGAADLLTDEMGSRVTRLEGG
jgi:multicomponent Na+:H+ antiporter subunit E